MTASDGSDTTARWLAGAALAVALVCLVLLILRRGRPARPAPGQTQPEMQSHG